MTSEWPPWALQGHFTQQNWVPCTKPQEERIPCCSGSHQPWELPQGHTLSAIVPLVFIFHACEHGASMTLIMVPGPGHGRKGSWVWMPYLGFRMTMACLQRSRSLFLAKLPWVTRMHWQSSGSADASQDGCAFLHGARTSPAEHTASCMRKLQRKWVPLLGSTTWEKSHCLQWETWHSTAPVGTGSLQYHTGSSTATHSISKIILNVVGWWRDTEELSPVCLWHILTANPNLCTVLSSCVVSPSSCCWQCSTSCSPGYHSLFCVKVILLTHVHLHVLQDRQGFSVKPLYSNFTKLILDISMCEYFPATCSQSPPLSAGLPVPLLWCVEGHVSPVKVVV